MESKLKITICLPVRNRITFANKALELMLRNSDYSIIVIDDASDAPDDKYIRSERIRVIYNKKKKGLVFLWNQLIKSSNTEYVIICSDKVRLQKKDFELIEEKLKEGFGIVATNIFHVLAFSKFLTTIIGFMDEGFTNCNYEDCDLQRRLFVNNIALYFTQESEVNNISSGWSKNDKGENKKYYEQKWIEDNKNKTLTLLHNEKNIDDRNYYKGDYKFREYLPWSSSRITVENLKNYFADLRLIDKTTNRKMS